MVFLSESRLIKRSWSRAAEIVFRSGSGVYLFALCIVLALDDPENQFPSVLPGWARVPEIEVLLGQASQLTSKVISPAEHTLLIALGIASGIVFFVILFILVFRVPFIRFDVLSGRRTDLREAWHENGGLALQWFLFGLCAGIVGALLSALFNLLLNPEVLGSRSGTTAIITLKNFFGIAITLYAYWFAEDFLVPVLSIEGGEVLPAIRNAWSLLRVDLVGLIRYVIAKTTLVAATAYLFVITWCCFARAFLVPLGRLLLHSLRAHSIAGVVHFSVGVAITVLALILAVAVFVIASAVASGFASAFVGLFALDFYSERYPALRELLQRDGKIVNS